MACFHPLHGWRSKRPGASGKYRVVFSPSAGYAPMSVPCGQCVGCRLERSRQWAMRCVHEASLHSESCFVTLTYSDEFLPLYGSLVKKDGQDFMKRLRWRYRDRRISFMLCGEYGDETSRPHYHALLFGLNFGDRRLLRRTPAGSEIYSSEILAQLWPVGHSSVGAVTFESAAYVSRYNLKKVNGDPERVRDAYSRVDPETGEVHFVEPEYATMSLRPAIGLGWFEKFKADVYPSDQVVLRGRVMRPPRFYDSRLDDSELEKIKLLRVERAEQHASDNTPARLQVRERVTLARLELYKRPWE